MRFVFYPLYFVFVGAFLGGLLGLGVGNTYVVLADVTSFEGTSGYVALSIAFVGCILGGGVGLVCGVIRAFRKTQEAKSGNHAVNRRTA